MKLFIYVALISLVILSVQCRQQEPAQKLNVVVSIVPLQEFVEKVGGEEVSVTVMVPPGASPHAYEPSPAQLVKVSKAHMYVKVGTPIEFEIAWLDKLLSMKSTMSVCDASTGIDLISVSQDDEREQSTVDPHIWLSPRNARTMVENICKGLVTVDSEHANYYEAKRDTYVARLDSLDRTIQSRLYGKQNRQFLVYHPAWYYFARDYSLEQVSVEAEGKGPTARTMYELILAAREYNIKTIFVSPQFSTKSPDVIASEIGGTVIHIDPLAKDYVANMEKVVRLLSAAME